MATGFGEKTITGIFSVILLSSSLILAGDWPQWKGPHWPSPQGFRGKGQFKAPVNIGKAWAHPVICDDRLYLRSQHTLMCNHVRAKE